MYQNWSLYVVFKKVQVIPLEPTTADNIALVDTYLK